MWRRVARDRPAGCGGNDKCLEAGDPLGVGDDADPRVWPGAGGFHVAWAGCEASSAGLKAWPLFYSSKSPGEIDVVGLGVGEQQGTQGRCPGCAPDRVPLCAT